MQLPTLILIFTAGLWPSIRQGVTQGRIGVREPGLEAEPRRGVGARVRATIRIRASDSLVGASAGIRG